MTSTESGKKKGHGLFGKKKENVDYRPSIGTSTPEPGPAVTTPMPQQSRQGQWGYQQQQQYQPAPANYQNTTPVEYLPPGQGYNPYQSQKQQEQYY